MLSAVLLVSGALNTIMFLATLLSKVEHFVNFLYVLSISSMGLSGWLLVGSMRIMLLRSSAYPWEMGMMKLGRPLSSSCC